MALAPWSVGLFVFGDEDLETKCVVGSAFQEGFSHAQNINAWAKVGAMPLTRACLQHPKVRHSIGDGNDNEQALACLIQVHNIIACTAQDILLRKGDNVTKLNSGGLSILLTWHQVSKVADMNKDKKLAEWLKIVGLRKSPPSFDTWADEDEVRLEEAQSDIVVMGHTALGHMEELKKKELMLAACAISQE